MARVKIKDLPKDIKISKEELKRIKGGALTPFLKIGGIIGESQDSMHEKWITIESFGYLTR